MEDLIQNSQTLFDERSSQSAPVPASNFAETTSAPTYGSLFLCPESQQPTTQGHPGFLGGLFTSTQSSFSLLPEDAAMDSHRTPSPTEFPSPLPGLPSSKSLTEGGEPSTQEQVLPKVRGPETVERLANSKPAEVVSIPSSSVSEWRLHQWRLPPHPAAPTTPQSPHESVLSSMSDFSLSSATSLQTGMGGLSQ